jgi:hypothetical protein
MLGAFGTLPGIKQLKQFSQQYPWMESTVPFLDALFNDETVRRDDPFLVYLQKSASRTARKDISNQLSNKIVQIAISADPALYTREWIVQLTTEYAPLNVLMSKGESPGKKIGFTGLNEHAAKIIMTSYKQYLDDGVDLNIVYNSLCIRMLRLKFDLSVATFVLDCLNQDGSQTTVDQSLLSEHAFAYHSLRLSQAVDLFVEEPIDNMLTSYRSMQAVFLKG